MTIFTAFKPKIRLALSILATFVVLPALASPPSDMVSLDLAKFRQKALSECIKLVGQDSLVGEGTVYFRDGASSLGLEPLFDNAAFVYVIELTKGILPESKLRLGYRLNLAGGENFVILPDPAIDSDPQYSLPGSGVVTLVTGTSKASVDQLINDLQLIAPEGSFEAYAEIGVLIFNVSIQNGAEVLAKLQESKLAANVDLNSEAYRQPFEFAAPVLVSDQGSIDADKYRTITLELRKEFQFASETTVPADLR